MNHRITNDRSRSQWSVLRRCSGASFALLLAVGVVAPRLHGEDCNANGVEDTVDLASQALELSVAERHEVGVTPRNVLAVDVNSDGALDVVSPNRHSNSLSVLLNRGDGRLRPPEFIAATNPAWIAAADFNRDGEPDIASVSTLASTLELFRGVPNLPSFSKATLPLGRGGWDFIESGDVDADTAPDLVLINRFDRLVAVLFNSGDDTFAFEAPVLVELPAEVVPRALTLLDLDGDGDLDVAVAGELVISGTPPTLGQLSLIVNRGDRTFDAPLRVPDAGANPRWVTAFDHDGDGDHDLAWADLGGAAPDDGALVLGENDGAGTFTPRVLDGGDVGFVLSGDFDGDTRPDLATLTSDGRVAFFRNEGGFQPTPAYVPSSIDNVGRAAVAADLDGDGVDELASANYTDEQRRNEVAVLKTTLVAAYFDANDDGVLDVCQTDCDGNGIVDSVDIASGTASDCNGNAVPDSCELEGNDDNKNGILEPCEDRRAVYGIEGPERLTAVAGTGISAEYVCTLFLDPDPVVPQRRQNHDGWSLVLAAEGVRIAHATHDVTMADDAPYGLHMGGFRRIDTATNGDLDGISAAVLLSLINPTTFPLRESIPLLRVTVEADLPPPGRTERAALFFSDDLLVYGQPVSNVLTVEKQSVLPYLGRKELALSRRSDLPVGPGRQFTTIQAAIDAASSGDHVVVAPGEYIIDTPIDFKGKAITVRSTAGAAATTVRMSSTPASPERASVVVFESGETPESVLEGFTLTGGRGSIHPYDAWILFESPVGGGIFCLDASPTVRDCVITRNHSMERISSGHSPPTNGGAAVTCLGDSRAVFERCVISNNRGGHAGGVLSVDASITVRNSTIVGNSGYHAGVFLTWLSREDAHPTVTGCLIAGNAAEGGFPSGRGLEIQARSWTVSYCTIADNAGGEIQTITAGSMVNTVAWSAAGRFSLIDNADVTHSDILASVLVPGEGNLNVDPGFVRPGVYDFERMDGDSPDFVVEPGDYRLVSASPGIDTGIVTEVFTTDLDGRPRRCGTQPIQALQPWGAAPDMGAYEQSCAVAFRRGDSNADGRLDISDSLYTLTYLFRGGPAPGCFDASDTDDSGTLDISDVVSGNQFLFLGGPPPGFPGPFECGGDRTLDELDCGLYAACR